MNTQKLTVEVPVVEGYEHTGEFRLLENGEYYHSNGRINEWTNNNKSDNYHLILRPIVRLRGPELFRAVINKIIASPLCWNQEVWETECKTIFCFGGWACQLAGIRCIQTSIQLVELLEITNSEALVVCNSNCDFHTLYMFALSKYEKSAALCKAINLLPHVSRRNIPSNYEPLE